MTGSLRVLSLPGRRFAGGNPYFRLFCEGLEAAGLRTVEIKSRAALLNRFDVVHLHFPEHYVTEQSLAGAFKWTGFYGLFLLRAKATRASIVWSVHDVHPFKNRHRWLLRPWMRLVHALVDAHVFMSPSSAREFAATFPAVAGKPQCRISHVAYPARPPEPALLAAERAALTDHGRAFVVGFLGGIKRYKNVGALRALPARLADGRPVRVLIAGAADAEAAAETAAVTAFLGPDRAIRRDERLTDAALDLLIRAVDVVFLPYATGWNSGLAMLVLSNGGRVIGSDLPVFADLAEEFGSPWVSHYGAPAELAVVLDRVASESPTDADRMRLRALLAARDGQAASAELARFYAGLRSR